ncbi:FlgD immunoglobulin-like domain containing protein [Streptomyces sp. NPDC008121]|uniref:FlgD immunoglobulin-like domain containing protein n=1 Tax=Streptomyces sp. NPDC008121 TaxID=3364809 RepID=UPI0036EAE5F9
MRYRARRHTDQARRRPAAIAVAVAAAAAATLLPLTGGPAVAAEGATPTAPLTIPAQKSRVPGQIVYAGATGFLQKDWQGYVWVTYADGAAVRYDAKDAHNVYGTGTGIARLYEPLGGPKRVVFQDGPTAAERTVTVPVNQSFAHVEAGSVVTTEHAGAKTVHVLSHENGVLKDRTVIAPAGAERVTAHRDQGNGKGFFVSYTADGAQRVGWVGLDDLVVRPTGIAYDITGRTAPLVGSRVMDFDYRTGRLKVWDTEGDLTRPVAEISVPEPPSALLGDYAVVREKYQDGDDPHALYPLDGGEPRPAFDADAVLGAPDDGALATVKGADGTYKVHRVQIPEDGSEPVLTPLYETALGITRTEQLVVAQGVLHGTENYEYDRYNAAAVVSRNLTLSGDLAAGPRIDRGQDGYNNVPGYCRDSCETIVPSGDGRLLWTGYPGNVRVAEEGSVLERNQWTDTRLDPSGFQSSGRYVAYVEDHSTPKTYKVHDIDTDKNVFSRAIGDRLTSLDGGTLWVESGTAGVVDAVDVRTGATTRSVKVANCDLTGLQAVGAAVYWKCATATGVKNLDTSANVSLPAHTSALLGDGYIAHVQGHTVSATPLRGGGATRVIGTVADPVPHRGWTVDRFGGHVSYVDAAENIHVVPVGVAAPPLRVLDTLAPAGVLDRKAADPTWSGSWWLSKPASSWRIAVRDAAGTVVRTLQGGETRGRIEATWDGKDASGTTLPDGLYDWSLTAVPADGEGAALTLTGDVALTRAQSLASGAYQPVTPSRVMDTRDGTGVAKAKVGAGKTVSLTVAGKGGVPARGVSAVVMNVTATNPTAGTFVSVHPYGTARTSASNLNVTAGQTVPNLVVVPVKDGKVSFYNRNGSVDLIADVAGYYTLTGSGSRFEPVTPSRVMDTRDGTGVARAKVGADKTVSLTVAGKGGVPATGVTAVVLNVTATNPTAGTFVSVHPYGTTRTSASNLNVTAGQTVPNLVVVPVKDGKVSFYNRNGSVDLIADVAGYYTDTQAGSLYEPVTPSRVMDTRDGTGVAKAKVGAGETVTLTVAGKGGVPATGVTAVVLNVTATNPTAGTFVSVHPYGTTRTSASNLNVAAGQTVPNLVVVPVKDGKVSFYNRNGSVDLIADVQGFHAP